MKGNVVDNKNEYNKIDLSKLKLTIHQADATRPDDDPLLFGEEIEISGGWVAKQYTPDAMAAIQLMNDRLRQYLLEIATDQAVRNNKEQITEVEIIKSLPNALGRLLLDLTIE
jgi:hypothetical protein